MFTAGTVLNAVPACGEVTLHTRMVGSLYKSDNVSQQGKLEDLKSANKAALAYYLCHFFALYSYKGSYSLTWRGG